MNSMEIGEKVISALRGLPPRPALMGITHAALWLGDALQAEVTVHVRFHDGPGSGRKGSSSITSQNRRAVEAQEKRRRR